MNAPAPDVPKLDHEALRTEVRTLMQALGPMYAARNARRYTWSTHTGAASHSSVLGFRVDPKPIEGKVVHAQSPWVVVKTERAAFAAVHESILATLPEVGSTVRITPYARRRFDGSRLDEPLTETHMNLNGTAYQVKTIKLGDDLVELPVQVSEQGYLRDLVTQMERLPMPDGMRTISQFLVDAHATGFVVIDPDEVDGNLVASPPSIRFEVDTARFRGEVEIAYDRGADYYTVRIGEEVLQDVDFDSLAAVLAERIDDGRWRIAPVEELKPVPRQRLRAA